MFGKWGQYKFEELGANDSIKLSGEHASTRHKLRPSLCPEFESYHWAAPSTSVYPSYLLLETSTAYYGWHNRKSVLISTIKQQIILLIPRILKSLTIVISRLLRVHKWRPNFKRNQVEDLKLSTRHPQKSNVPHCLLWIFLVPLLCFISLWRSPLGPLLRPIPSLGKPRFNPSSKTQALHHFCTYINT